MFEPIITQVKVDSSSTDQGQHALRKGLLLCLFSTDLYVPWIKGGGWIIGESRRIFGEHPDAMLLQDFDLRDHEGIARDGIVWAVLLNRFKVDGHEVSMHDGKGEVFTPFLFSYH